MREGNMGTAAILGQDAKRRSAKTKPSRSTTSPTSTAIGRENIGPAETQEWNSPFSPHGSTDAGRSASSGASKARPANDRSSFRGFTQ